MSESINHIDSVAVEASVLASYGLWRYKFEWPMAAVLWWSWDMIWLRWGWNLEVGAVGK